MVGSPSLVVAVAPPLIATAGETVSTLSVWVELDRFPAASDTDMTTRCGPSERVAAVIGPGPAAIDQPGQGLVGEGHGHGRAGRDGRRPGDVGRRIVGQRVRPAGDRHRGCGGVDGQHLAVGALVAGRVGDGGGDGAGAVGQRGRGHVPRIRPDCTSAVRVCESTATRTTVPGATSLVPAIVGVGSFVVTDDPPSMVTTGSTVSTVSCWVALPGFPAPSMVEATTGIGGVREDRRGHRPCAAGGGRGEGLPVDRHGDDRRCLDVGRAADRRGRVGGDRGATTGDRDHGRSAVELVGVEREGAVAGERAAVDQSLVTHRDRVERHERSGEIGVRADGACAVDLPEHPGRLGAAGQHDMASGGHGHGAVDLEDEDGVRVARAVEGHRAGVRHGAGDGVQPRRDGRAGQRAVERATAGPTGDLVVRRDEVGVCLGGGRVANIDRAGDDPRGKAGGLRVRLDTEVAPERGVGGGRGADRVADGGAAQHRVGRRRTEVHHARRGGDGGRGGQSEDSDQQGAGERSEVECLRPACVDDVDGHPDVLGVTLGQPDGPIGSIR